jgi:hypothetical protein
MIVAKDWPMDLMIHFLVLIVLGAYFRYIRCMSTAAFIATSFAAAALVTLLNHTLWPELRIIKSTAALE